MSINQLVQVKSVTIGTDEVNAVDARELHSFLEIGRDYSTWIKGRISEYEFAQGNDYEVFTDPGENLGGRPKVEYIVSIDMAKELSMVEKNDKGKEARKYFIACEKKLKEKTKSTAEVAMEDLSVFKRAVEFFGVTGNQAKLSANTAVKKIHGIDFMEATGITHLISETKTQYLTPTVLGKPHGISARKINIMLEAAGMQKATRDHKNRIVWIVTDEGKKYSELLDTNKKHSDGSPVMQIKWCDDVLREVL